MKSNVEASIANDIELVTPDDDLVQEFSGFKVKGNAGNVAVVTKAGNTITIPMETGEGEPVQVTKILATGTTATGIYGYKIFNQHG